MPLHMCSVCGMQRACWFAFVHVWSCARALVLLSARTSPTIRPAAVLVRRSTARLSSGQRTALNDVEEAHAEERDGQTYWVYEHTTQVGAAWRLRCGGKPLTTLHAALAGWGCGTRAPARSTCCRCTHDACSMRAQCAHAPQGSPTISSTRTETYRHALAVSTTRPGLDGKPYIYTLNMSCPQVRVHVMGAVAHALRLSCQAGDSSSRRAERCVCVSLACRRCGTTWPARSRRLLTASAWWPPPTHTSRPTRIPGERWLELAGACG